MTNCIPRACYAPALTDGLLKTYAETVATQPDGPVKDALAQLMACVKAWWAAPESTRDDGSVMRHIHNGKEIEVREAPFTAELVQSLWDVTPYPHELAGLSTSRDDGLFDSLQGDLRTMAFHLLWHVNEIARDREPITLDRLPA